MVEAVAAHLAHIIVVDDGSAVETRDIVANLGRDARAIAVHRPHNGGKGAAVKTGLVEARARGFSHAFQVDADGQHDLTRVAAFLAAAKAHPEAAVLAWPTFSDDVPKSRLHARKITRFWVDIETGGRVIEDAMVGFRVYPLAATLACGAEGDWMDFDIEVAVRLAWAGVPIVNLPVPVHYLSEADGGVSHFHLVRDNLRISWLHARLTTGSVIRRLLRPLRRSS